MTEGPIPANVRKYLSEIGKKGGTKGAAVTNAKLTSAQRKRAGKKAAAALTPEARSKRASLAAKARWAKVKAAKEKL